MGAGIRVTPKNILDHLEKHNMEVPLRKNLYNYMARFKTKLFGGSRATLGELVQWLQWQ